MNDRSTELEIQLVHMQRLYDQLNEVVTEQSLELDRMQRRMTMLETQLKNVTVKSEPAEDPLDEKPPHY